MRPLSTKDLGELANVLDELAGFLRSEAAPRTQRLLAEFVAIGYPAKASGTPSANSNKVDENGHPVAPDTAVERSAFTEDPGHRFARETIAAQRHLHRDVVALLSALEGLAGSRAIETCGRCDQVLERGRCVTMIDGVRCGAEWPTCKGCGEEMPPGDRHGGRCGACAKFRQRNGYDKASAKRYAQMTVDIVVDGAYSETD